MKHMSLSEYKKKCLKSADILDIEYDVALSSNFLKARLKAGLTQEQLAEKMGTKQPAIARAENGNVPPSHIFLKKAAIAMKMNLKPPQFV